MNVLIGQRKYQIGFQYGDRAFGGHPLREYTACLIRDLTDWRLGSPPPPIVGKGEVVRYFRDKPNRELARKLALKKAVDNLVPRRRAGCLHDREIYLERRRAFWKAYLNRKEQTPVQKGAKQRRRAYDDPEVPA